MKQETLLKKPIRSLKLIAAKHFHAFIRERDKDQVCISCGKPSTLECGHFYSAGHYPNLRFNEDNSHGQCKRCNRFLHGNLNEYRINLVKRIGQDRLEKLDLLSAYYKRYGYKWDKFFLIETIINYRNK